MIARRYMRYFFPIIVVSLLTVACNKKLDVKDNSILVKVGNKTLYRNVLEENIPTGLSREDSTIAAEHFIRTWIDDVLLYDIAVKNLNDKENIDRLVEEYRKSLVIYQYQEQLVNEKLSDEIDEQSMNDYYNNNKDNLKLEQPLVKGLFLKVPVSAPQLDEIRKWYKLPAPNSRDQLEKYSLNNAVIFNYFVDKWMDFGELMNNLPKEQLTKDDLAVNKKAIERQIDGYCYFLNITDYLQPGDNAPFEYVQPVIREILINQRKIDFLKNTGNDLYQRAVNRGEIQFNKE